MPKKHTTEDQAFIRGFSIQIKAAYEIARNEGVTRTEFSKSLGIGSTTLQDFLDARSMPSVRSLALAVEHYDVDLTYEGTGFRAHKAHLARPTEEQLTLPFVLSSVDPRTTFKLGPVTGNTIAFGVLIRRTG